MNKVKVKVKVKFKRQSTWNIGGELKPFKIGDIFETDEAMAEQMVTHNYADYVDKKLAKKDMIEENKAVEATEESKDEDDKDEDDLPVPEPEAKSKKKSGRPKKSK